MKPNSSTPLMLAKRARGICEKHLNLWELTYFNRRPHKQICDEVLHALSTKTRFVMDVEFEPQTTKE